MSAFSRIGLAVLLALLVSFCACGQEETAQPVTPADAEKAVEAQEPVEKAAMKAQESDVPALVDVPAQEPVEEGGEEETPAPIHRVHPGVAPADLTEEVKLAASPDTPPDKRFDAVHKLATSGYTDESAEALTTVACDTNAGETTRGYAAMGLRNFTLQLPEYSKRIIADRLRAIMEKEKADTPDGIIRTLLDWGDARFVSEILGGKLEGHPMEIEILAGTDDRYSTGRLWELYQSCPQSRRSDIYNRKAAIGRALVDKGDERGIEILMTLLPANEAPGAQYRHNVYMFIARAIGESFGYSATNYDATLEEAVPKMLSWWAENRNTFELRSGDKRQ